MMKHKNGGLVNFFKNVSLAYSNYTWLLFLIYIAFFFLYITYTSLNVISVEQFTPQIRQLYRPKLRHLQDVYENFSNNAKYIMMKRLKMNNLY